MHAEMLQSENVFDGAQHIRCRVVSRDYRAVLHIRSNNESRAAVGADVVRAVLRIVFDDEN